MKLLERIPDSMRVVAAGLLIFLAVLVVVNVLGEDGFERMPPWISGGALGARMIALCLGCLWLFNPKGSGFFGGKTAAEHIAELERLGLVEDESFRVVRAFGVEE